MMKRNVKAWTIGIGVFFILASLFLSDSFRTTLHRRRAATRAVQERQEIEQKIDSLQKEIAHLRNNPETYEQMVRQELGYVRPGETEIRFVRAPRKGN